MRRLRTLKHLVVSFLGGIGTYIAISCLDWLPYSRARDTISDTLTFPGGFIAHLFYPAGIHTSGGAPGWATIAIGTNFFFYILFWFVVILMIAKRKAGRLADVPPRI